MSRERFISPQTWTSEQFCSVSFLADLMFIGIISTADDHGRRRGSLYSIMADVFPTRGLTLDQIKGARDELQRAKLIQVYADESGRELVSIPGESWKRYQKPRYVSESKYPAFPGAYEVRTDSVQTGTEPEQTCAESVQICCSGVVGCGGVGGGVQPPSPPSPLTLDVSVADTGLTASGNGKQRTERPTAGKAHTAPQQPTATAPATPNGNDHSERKLPRYNGDPGDPRPWVEVTSDTRKRFGTWAARDGGKFRMLAQLQRMMRQADADDPVRLLAHVLEVDAMETADSALAMLYERLRSRKDGEGWLTPAEEALAEAKAIVNRDAEKRGGHPQLAAAIVQAAIEGSKREEPPGDDRGPGPGGGGLKSPAATLQEKLEAKRAREVPAKTTGENRPPPQEPPKPVSDPIVTRAQRRRARRRTAEDADLAEVPAPIARLFEGLTAGWSGPNDTNHAAEKRVVHTLLAGNAIRALAYADMVNRTAIVRGEDPWIVMAGMCRDLPEEALPSRERAIRLIRDAPRCTGDTS